jgi:hypothetical protein
MLHPFTAKDFLYAPFTLFWNHYKIKLLPAVCHKFFILEFYMRLHRLIAILLLIESRGSIKTKELADALETSVRTIHRDIDILCESGIPITAATGPNGGIRFIEGYYVNINNLHCDDIISLFLCGIGVVLKSTASRALSLRLPC